MSFYEQLQTATADARQHLLSAPIITDCLQGRVSRANYLAFLAQAVQGSRQAGHISQ